MTIGKSGVTLLAGIGELANGRRVLEGLPQRNIGGKARAIGRQAQKDRRLATIGQRGMVECNHNRAIVRVDEQLAMPEDIGSRACVAVGGI